VPGPLVHLASASPRRRELLAQIGVRVALVAVPIDETRRVAEPPSDYVRRLAREKVAAARRAGGLPPLAVVLAADTAVVCDAAILGKPGDEAAAVQMLARLSGVTHDVLTAVAVSSAAGESVTVSASRVSFRLISTAEAHRYWATGEPADKAGGYAIQGLGALFVRSLEGSYSGVMGLPLYETGQLLAEHGIACGTQTEAGT
jgi:septum formation protein